MIKWFRSGIALKIAGVVFAGLMLIFMLTAVDWSKLTTGTSVGSVNGHAIDARVYSRAVQQATEQRQRQTQQSLGIDDDRAIRNDVWEKFITNDLLQSEYARRGIRVTNDEIFDAIRTQPLPEFYELPEFQTDSQFDMAKYQKWLSSSVAQQFVPSMEAQYRDEIERSKLFRAVTADVFLSNAALWQRYRDLHETVTIDLAAIVPRQVISDSAVSVTPAEVEAYYKAHQAELAQPRTIFTSYLAIPRLPDASDTAAARARAEELRKEIQGGAPFADVAKRESADSASAAKGGELGEWTRGRFDPKFDSVAFSLPIGALSEPVLTRFGLHIIQIESRKGNKAKGRHILIPIEITGAHRDRLDAEADTLDRLAADRVDAAALDTAARALHLRIGTSKPLTEGDKMRIGVLTLPDAGAWAERAKVGQISPIIETPFALYLFRVDSTRPPGLPRLAQIRDEVTQAARNQKKLGGARKIADELVQRIDHGATLAQAADSMKLPHEVIGPFTRVTSPVHDPVVVGTAFGLEKGKHSGVIAAKDGLYVLRVLDHAKADSATFVKDLDKFRQQAQVEARQERVQVFLAGLRSKANIVDKRAKVLQTAPGAAGPGA
ncbi:MAG TPA: peptidylprolyl isomerase [Gemmatimonadales bacterium]|nr:peptidylprolyl isomerase [Gemmatimonadales bacterium]